MNLFKDLQTANLGFRPEVGARAVGLMPLIKEALNNHKVQVFEIEEEGSIRVAKKDDLAAEPDATLKYHELVQKLGGHLVYKFLGDFSSVSLYVWENGVVELDFSGNYLTVHGLHFQKEILEEIKGFVENNWAPPEKTGHIYAIMRQGMHLSLSSLGNAGIPLEAGNYTPAIMEEYRFVIKDLQSVHPSGRIVIMEGKPGTGKTHLVRAMLTEVPDAMFVLVSPEIVPTLAGPELLPLLINYRGGVKGPIILVLEDADRCLVTRGSDNINSIQALLNLGDGILGSMLDLRIVATTNASKLEMEAAILRKGRLSKRIEVGPLDVATSQAIFKRLLPDAKLPAELTVKQKDSEQLTLADVYALARTHGWTPALREMDKDDEDEDYDD